MPRYGLGYALLTAAYCGLLFFLSSQSNLSTEQFWFLDWPQSDKLVHMTLFGGLSGLVALGLYRSNAAVSRGVLFWTPALLVTFYGLTDEFHQSYVPNRSCDLLDLLADSSGATIIAGVFTVWAESRRIRRASA